MSIGTTWIQLCLKWALVIDCASGLQVFSPLHGPQFLSTGLQPWSFLSLGSSPRWSSPPPPFLFIINMEGLSVVIKIDCLQSSYHGIQLPNLCPTISYIFYVDDVIFIGKWSCSNFTNLSWILRCFHVVSGLNVNFLKLCVFGIDVHDSEVANCASILWYIAATLLFIWESPSTQTCLWGRIGNLSSIGFNTNFHRRSPEPSPLVGEPLSPSICWISCRFSASLSSKPI